MKRPPLFALLAVLALFVGLGCQIADLLADKPTPPPAQPPVVGNTGTAPTVPPLVAPTVPLLVAPTVPPLVAPTIPPLVAPTVPPSVVPTDAQTPPVVASPTLPPVAQPTQPPPPPAQSSTCTNPNAAITAPAMDSVVSGLIEIHGTATRPDMDYWKVESRADTNTNYDVLNRSDKAMTDGVLARWSTKTVPNGVYFVRLVIVQKDGNFPTPCEIRVTVSN